jgi:hypothetical protein
MRRQSIEIAAVCLAALLVAQASTLSAAEKFPYTAEVIRDSEAYAGPGHKYYATDRLAKGEQVEVYARDSATGFLAIRPPQQSFSWVPADHVRLDPGAEQVGEVVAPTHSWIGTDVEHIREHKFQVRLPVGELLQVIGKRQIQTADGQVQTWLKIAPPAGEFRWIDPKSIGSGTVTEEEAEEPDDEDAKIELASVELPQRGVNRSKKAPARKVREEDEEFEDDDEPIVAQPVDDGRPRRKVAPAIALRDLNHDGSERLTRDAVEKVQFASATSTPTAKPKTTGDGFVPRRPRTLEAGAPIGSSPANGSYGTMTSTPASRSASLALRSDERVARLERATPSLSRSAPAIGSNGLISSEEVRQQLDAIDLDLSLMLAQPKETWNLEPLERRVLELVDKGETAADRGEARLMHEKIKQIQATFNVSDPPPAAPTTAYAAMTREAADPRYDGQGWLKPVLSRTRHVAPYALVDSDGKPICFVTPAPGFRIEGYVNKRVGVYGRRGRIESLNAQHVLAERVIDLDKQLR